MLMAMYSFFEEYDFSGKTIIQKTVYPIIFGRGQSA